LPLLPCHIISQTIISLTPEGSVFRHSSRPGADSINQFQKTEKATTATMVCAKCQKLNKTTLATPGVKKKAEMYYGSAASSSASGEKKKSATIGQTGISKVGVQNMKSTPLPANRLPEQTALQGCPEPLRPVLQLLHPLQDQGFSGALHV
jgi:hypothetical protein